MDFAVRTGRPDEFDEIVDVTARSFGHTREFFLQYFRNAYPDARAARACVVAVADRRIVGVINQTPMRVRLGRARLRAAGIGGVSCVPEARGHGVMSAMLAFSRDLQRRKGVPLGMLGGKRSRYRRFGFEQAGRTLVADLPDELLAEARPADYRTLRPADAEAVARKARATGMSIHRTAGWQRWLLQRPQHVGYRNRGRRLRAYFVASARAPTHITEAVGPVDVLAGMLRRYQQDQGGEQLSAELLPGTEVARWALLSERAGRLAVQPTWQVCIYEFGAFLRALGPELVGRLRAFGLYGSVRLRNETEDTCYELRPKSGRLEVTAYAGRARPDVSLPADGWVRTFFPPGGAPLIAPDADPRLPAALAFELNVPAWDHV